jgi:uncharacterized protein
MRERSLDPLRLDVRAFTRDGGHLGGQWAIDALPRLADSLQPTPTPPPVTWAADGGIAGGGADRMPSIHLTATATLTLQCQRCLQPIDWPVAVDSRFRFAATEDDAARLDAESDDDDVLALQRELDLRALLEDELLLALPIVPRHAVCTPPAPLADQGSEADEPPTQRPFAALEALRKRSK